MLIKCPECGKEISDKAISCPNCGCPNSEFNKVETKPEEEVVFYVYEDDNAEKAYEIIKQYSNPEENMMQIITRIRSIMDIDFNTAKDLVEKYITELNGEKEIINNKYADIIEEPKHEFTGVYKSTLFGGMKEVYCPRCNSENCSHYIDKKVIPGKTKTQYSANLNPLKPFTLLNKKEKVVKKEEVITENKFLCNNCGKIFY